MRSIALFRGQEMGLHCTPYRPARRIVFLISALILAITATHPVRGAPLNVLMILVDDWGWTDAAVLGSDYYETPNIDRLAEESLRFTQAYSASPVCSPTRAALLTGKWPARLDMTIWHEGAVAGGPRNRRLLPAAAEPNLPREEVTIAEILKQHDYFTAHIGKWHLGKAAYYPETQGFDLNIGGTYWGAPASFFYPYRGAWSKSDPELRYVPVGLGKAGDYLTDQLTDHAMQILRERHAQPFYINLWYHTVHTPIEGKAKMVSRFEQKPNGENHRHATYAAMVQSLDDNVGRILSLLDELELAESTIVILTSDNGGVDFPSRKSDDQPPTSNIPLRSGKGTLYEGGIRVPLMIRWPGKTSFGKKCDSMVTSQDLFPTLAEGLGIKDAPQTDGESLVSLLVDANQQLDRQTLYWHYPHYYTRMTPASAIRDGNWKLIHYYEDDRLELFNLEDDLGEEENLVTTEPEIARQLRIKLDRWRVEVDANEPSPNR